MKRLINAIQWAFKVYSRPQMFQPSMLEVMESQFNFFKKCGEENKPLISKLCTIYWDNDGKEQNITLLSLWCGIGDSNPIDRIEQLSTENQMLKKEVSKLLQKNMEL